MPLIGLMHAPPARSILYRTVTSKKIVLVLKLDLIQCRHAFTTRTVFVSCVDPRVRASEYSSGLYKQLETANRLLRACRL